MHLNLQAIRSKRTFLRSEPAYNVTVIGTPHPLVEGHFILEGFDDSGVEYFSDRHLIWSIGKHKVTGLIIASTSYDLYQNPEYECIWLR